MKKPTSRKNKHHFQYVIFQRPEVIAELFALFAKLTYSEEASSYLGEHASSMIVDCVKKCVGNMKLERVVKMGMVCFFFGAHSHPNALDGPWKLGYP